MRKFSRRRKKKTNYRKRLGLLKSGKTRIVVGIFNNNIKIQFIDFKKQGDQTIIEVNSSSLEKIGWKAHRSSMPCAYLLGLLAGKKALKKDVSEAIFDIGLQNPKNHLVLYSVAKGVSDSGIKLPLGHEVPEDRIKGRHIVDYAKKLKTEDNKKYERQFSSYLKKGLNPEDLGKHFEEIKGKIKG